MKFLKDKRLNLSEEDYHALPCWSYSLIAKYAKGGFESLATLHDRTQPTPSMEFGSLLDSMLTRGRKTLDEYVVYSGSPVPPAEKNALAVLYKATGAKRLEDISDGMLDAVTEGCQYYPRWSLMKKREHLENCSDYYDVIASGKKVVSGADWDDALQMTRIFRSDPYLKTLFGTRSTEDVEYVYQSQFMTDWILPSGRRVSVKIMPDLLVVDRREKTVQPVDLKTSSAPAWKFKDNFLDFCYYIQATLYSDVLSLLMAGDEEYARYAVLPYLFTDISRSDMIPVTYRYDQTDPAQRDGLQFESNGKVYKYKSWQTLLDEIASYEESEARVPSYIKTDAPNDLITILKESKR